MPHPYTIIAVEDNRQFHPLLRAALDSQGTQVRIFLSGEELFAAEADLEPDLFLLDLVLPGMDGMEICDRIRKTPRWRHLPVIILTSKDTEADRVTGLDQGADDYLVKPINIPELKARIRAHLRRQERTPAAAEPAVLRLGDLSVDAAGRGVTLAGRPIALTRKEFDLLLALLENRGRVLDRGELMHKVWGLDYLPETRSLDVHIRSLRQKIEEPSRPTPLIETVRGVGYRIS
jgi:two-component system, OmpR family, alkaline phosphatase synthesis response regulator PhoP